MERSEIRDALDREFDFPVGNETVIKEVGDAEIEFPNVGSGGERIETVLERTGRESYESADDVYTALLGSVDGEYVGRRYYDDRGGVRSIDYERPDGGMRTI